MAFINDIITTNTVDTEELELPSNLTDMEMEYITKDLESLLAKMDTTNKEYHSYLKQIEYLSNIDTESLPETDFTFEAYKEALGVPSNTTIDKIIAAKDSVTQKYEGSMEGFFGDLWDKFKLWLAIRESKRIPALEAVKKANENTGFKSVEVFKKADATFKGEKTLSRDVYAFVKGIGNNYYDILKEIEKGTLFLSPFYEKLADTVVNKFENTFVKGNLEERFNQVMMDKHRLTKDEVKKLKQKRYFIPYSAYEGEFYIFYHDKKGYLDYTWSNIQFWDDRLGSKIMDDDTVKSLNIDLSLIEYSLSMTSKEVFTEGKRLKDNYIKVYKKMIAQIKSDMPKDQRDLNTHFANSNFYSRVLNFMDYYVTTHKEAIKIAQVLDVE